MYTSFDENNFHELCEILYEKDDDLRKIHLDHGHPPMWTRPASFQTLILFILEQQVSLASAYAAFRKLREKIGFVTPAKIAAMTDSELRSCYFSRQKAVYAKEVARAFLSRQITLKKLHATDDDNIRTVLKKVKGIGDWTVDVYLMHAMRRLDIFPIGDIALVNSMKDVKKLPKEISREKMLEISKQWQPYRTIASMILWHSYIKKRGIVLQG